MWQLSNAKVLQKTGKETKDTKLVQNKAKGAKIFLIVALVNKHYEYMVTLIKENLPLKCCPNADIF